MYEIYYYPQRYVTDEAVHRRHFTGEAQSLHVGFVANTRLLERGFIQVPRFSSVRMIQPMVHYVHSFIYHRPDASLATEGVGKQHDSINTNLQRLKWHSRGCPTKTVRAFPVTHAISHSFI
jgi:hypothetical protein